MNSDIDRIVDELVVDDGFSTNRVLRALKIFVALDHGIREALDNNENLDIGIDENKNTITSRAIENIIKELPEEI